MLSEELLAHIKDKYVYDNGKLYIILRNGNEREVGYPDKDGYLCVSVKYKTKQYKFRSADIVWYLCKQVWPEKQLDHKDRDNQNNKIDNLREATTAENLTNRILSTSYTWAGITKPSKNYHHYMGRFTHNGIRYTTATYKCPTAAAIAREKLIKEVGATFAVRNFT